MSNSQGTRVLVPDNRCGGRVRSTAAYHGRKKSRVRYALPACEALEGRVVLTYSVPGTSLLGSLSYVGVVTSPVVVTSVPTLPPIPVPPTPLLPILPGAPTPVPPVPYSGASSVWTQLRSDLQTLRVELQSLAQKSGVTIADVQSLTSDSEAIATSGFRFGVKSLNPTISELATAVAGGASTGQAQTDFTALFNGSSVATTTITTTFNDLVQTIKDSAVTTTDLSIVAADEAAVQADLSKLRSPWLPEPEPWLDQVGATPGSVTLANNIVSVPSPVVSPSSSVSPPTAVLPPIIQPPIIISPFGNTSLLGSLSSVGVVTSPVVVSPWRLILPPVPLTATAAASTTATGPFSQLQADEQKLQAELQSLAAKSGLTIADLQNLVNDSRTINLAGFYFDSQSLNKPISELATAVAGGLSTAQAQTDFTALFNGSKVSTSTINTTFSDLAKAIQDSKVLPGDLTTVAADQAAIQADLKYLFPFKGGGSEGSGSSSGESSSGGTGGGTTGTTATGNSGGRKHHFVVRHNLHHVQHIKVANLVHGHKLARLKKH
jgi:hypothetical protein